MAWTWNQSTDNSIGAISFKTVNEAIEFVERISFITRTHVLVTGSLHLLGSVLQVLHEDPIFKASANEEYLMREKIRNIIATTNKTTINQSQVENTEVSTNNQCKKRPPPFFLASIH